MKVIDQVYEINAPAEKVWEALVNPDKIEAWGAGPAEMKDEEGFEFSLWGGEIFGKNIKVLKNKKLVQEWFAGKWDKPSIVELGLSGDDEVTTVKLHQVDVPDSEYEDVKDGWDKFYFGPLTELLETN